MWALNPAITRVRVNRSQNSYSQGRLAVPALWPWHPKMLCPLLWPSQSPLMRTSKDLIPLSESHMTCCSKASTWTCTHTHYIHICTWTTTYMIYHMCPPLWAPWVVMQSVERFALVWHNSFRVDNVHGADYSLGQRKHTAFYWLTAVKLLLCKKLIFAGIGKWNIS